MPVKPGRLVERSVQLLYVQALLLGDGGMARGLEQVGTGRLIGASILAGLLPTWRACQVVPAVQWSVEPAKVPQRAQQAVQPRASRMRLCGDCSHRIRHRMYPAGHPSTVVSEKKAPRRPVGNRAKASLP